ncbi:MAG TPA: hypothetical protein VHA82_07740 [Ramlibacter sp.]|uniref:tetratricopeptide repeat protein n=1 Tax=Ramlibacter sp. TaxID=1917967 RepID=UPI002CB633AA|nr:hypothetical protein [Ramlibacter sp.]HVZ43688.1 hypothetical protein [Ramlibacter sp.]
MTAFFFIASLVTLAVVAVLMVPLLRPRVADGEREQGSARPAPARKTALAVALSVPFAAAAMYGWLGSPSAVDAARAQDAQSDQIARMVDGLAAKLKANPDNPKGWAMLGRSYKVMGRLREAEEAYERSGALLQTDPDVMVSYADLLAARTASLEGRPIEIVRKALALQPAHPIGLMLMGTASYRDGDYAGAVHWWEKLMAQLEPGSSEAQEVQAAIDDARGKGGLPGVAATATATATTTAQAAPPAAMGAPNPEDMVARLAARLKANPDDPAGWARLARAYEVLGKPEQARDASAQQQLAQARANGARR